MAERTLLAVDGNSLVHRSYHANARTGFALPDGRGAWAVRGLIAQIGAAAERVGADAILVGFDDPSASERRQRWPHYKAQRAPKLPGLAEQLELAAELVAQLGAAVVVPPGLEADDVLASAAAHAPQVGARTVVMTSDRDAFALVDAHTRVLRIINGGVEASPLLDIERTRMVTGVTPDQYRDLAALRGDPSDNLPGVRGIGPKKAALLLAEFGSAQAAFDDAATGGERLRAVLGAAAAATLALPESRLAWAENCDIMTMRRDVDLGHRSGDETTGPLVAGALPLDPEVVREVAIRLDVSLRHAHRTLSWVEAPEPQPGDQSAPTGGWDEPAADPGWRPSYGTGRRFPPLPRKVGAAAPGRSGGAAEVGRHPGGKRAARYAAPEGVEQLSLF